jgi:hypothetical protein
MFTGVLQGLIRAPALLAVGTRETRSDFITPAYTDKVGESTKSLSAPKAHRSSWAGGTR